MNPATCRVATLEVSDGTPRRADDTVVTEEPLEIRALFAGTRFPVAVTMRTPGADFELAAGFLYNEGLVKGQDDLRRLSYCAEGPQRYNIVNVELAGAVDASALAPLERHFSMTSACGVCGKATAETLRQRGCQPVGPGPQLAAEVLSSLPAKLRDAQKLFGTTGGLHAAGLFSPDGELVAAREDVGRHNALDKVVGWALMAGRLPLTGHVMLVSGRASFELVQKSLSAGVAALCSVSAPSSLAVDLAREFSLTLACFVRPGRFKLYSAPERVFPSATAW